MGLNIYDYINYDNGFRPEQDNPDYQPQPGTLDYNFGTTGHQCYLVELEDPGERMELQFMPASLDGESTADIKEVTIVGRNNPLLHYTSGRDTLNIPLEFYADSEARDDVIKKIQWLKSLRMNNGFQGKVRNVMLVMGDLFKNNEIWAVRNVRYSMSHFDGAFGFLPLRATADVSLVLDPDKNLLVSDVRR